MRLFTDEGFGGTSIRRIAAEAGVSPALVMHHYGSKEALRSACDRYALEATRGALGSGAQLWAGANGGGSQAALDAMLAQPLPVVLPYVARAVVEGTPAGDALVDEVVAVTRASMDEMVAAGVMAESDDPEMRAVLLTLFDLAPVILARQVTRLTGADPRSPDGLARQARAVLALYETPLLLRKDSTS